MKVPVNITRIIVGLLFIFSGLIKANDPMGLSYKMQEFFDLWGISHFNSWTLSLSILTIAFEIVAGFALLLGWKMNLFSWLLLLLIIFFTFLTGYAYLSGKFKNCGCFGDCIPITSQTSFIKDIILTVLIVFLFVYRKKIKPILPANASFIAILLITAASFAIQWYTLNYLPVLDCLPFKKGNNIAEKMKMPKDAIRDSTVITFIYEKAGQKVEFTADKFPADFNTDTYKFINRYDKVVRHGKNNEPPIKGFALSGAGTEDSTQIVLQNPYAVLLFCEDFSTPVKTWEKDFEQINAEAQKKNIPVYIITKMRDEALQQFKETSFSKIPVFKCDFTAIRTAARTNPTIYFIQTGTIIGKWSYRQMDKAKALLSTIAAQSPASIVLPVASDTTKQQP